MGNGGLTSLNSHRIGEYPVKLSGQKNLSPESSGVCKDQVLTLLPGDKEMNVILLYY